MRKGGKKRTNEDEEQDEPIQPSDTEMDEHLSTTYDAKTDVDDADDEPSLKRIKKASKTGNTSEDAQSEKVDNDEEDCNDKSVVDEPTIEDAKGRQSRGSRKSKIVADEEGNESGNVNDEEAPKRKGPKRVAKNISKQQSNEENSDMEEAPKRKGHKRASRKRKQTKVDNEDQDDDDTTEYEVKEVLNLRNRRGVREFLVSWKGFKASANSWEPESNLSCKALIDEFLKKSDTKVKKSPAKKKGKSQRGQKKTAAKNGKGDDSEEEDDDDAESTTEYEVKQIVEVHHKRDGTREFLVRWKGFSARDDTWEPEENLNCPDLISEFEARVSKLKNSSSRETRVQRKPTDRLVYDTKRTGKGSRTRGLRRTYYDED